MLSSCLTSNTTTRFLVPFSSFSLSNCFTHAAPMKPYPHREKHITLLLVQVECFPIRKVGKLRQAADLETDTILPQAESILGRTCPPVMNTTSW